MTGTPTIAPDAAIVLGIAATAMPFARTAEAEAERWLRILRVHGEAGAALQALGVSEGRLQAARRDSDVDHWIESAEAQPARASIGQRADPVELVSAEAVAIARRRGRLGVATAELLLAVICVYGEDFDRVLLAHGADRDELVTRLDGEPGARLSGRAASTPR